MGCVGAKRADEAWVPMDLAEGQVCAAVPMGCGQAWAPMGCGQAWATKGWVLETSTAEPMGCEQVCAGEAPGSVHGRAVACTAEWEPAYPKGWPVSCCHMGREACRMGHEALEASRMGPVVYHMEPLASSPMD